MKILTKILASVSLLFAVSCSSDDSSSQNNSNSVDPIIGKYNQIQRFDGGSEVNLDECELLENIAFTVEGNVLEEDWDPNFISDTSSEFDGCILSKTTEFSWDREGDDYFFTREGVRFNANLALSGDTITRTFFDEDGNVVQTQVFQKDN